MSYADRLITRAQWGARAPVSSTYQATQGTDLTVHWEGPFMGIAGEAHSVCAGRVRSIQNYHINSGSFNDIAYNYVACQHGYIFEGRGPSVLSGANGTSNANWASKAVCYLGGQQDPFTSEAKLALVDLGQYHISLMGTSARWCHNDWVATACPGGDICTWVKTAGAWAPSTPVEPTPSRRRLIPVELRLRRNADGTVRRFPAGFAGVPWGSVAYDGMVPVGAVVGTHPINEAVGTYSANVLVNGAQGVATEASWGVPAHWPVTGDSGDMAFVSIIVNVPHPELAAGQPPPSLIYAEAG